VWDVWYGPPEVLAGFKTQKNVFVVLVISDAITFLSTLPSRNKGRIMQFIMFAWTLEMSMVSVATFVL
jgi:hypothetical protein